MKALKSNSKILTNNGKIVATNTELYTGLGNARKSYFMRDGKIITDANGKPYRAVGLSPVMEENSWAEIGNAIKAYNKVGCPWALGSSKKIRYRVSYTEDVYGTVDSGAIISEDENDFLVENNAYLVGVHATETGAAYTFAVNPVLALSSPFYTGKAVGATGWWQFENRNYYGYITPKYEQGEYAGVDYHNNAWVDRLVFRGNSILANNNFGVASLVDVTGNHISTKNFLPYYDTFKENTGGAIPDPIYFFNKPSLVINVPSAFDFVATRSAGYPPQDVVASGTTIHVAQMPNLSADDTSNPYCIIEKIPTAFDTTVGYQGTSSTPLLKKSATRTTTTSDIGTDGICTNGRLSTYVVTAYGDNTQTELTTYDNEYLPKLAIFCLYAAFD